jgi:hypothetical protein
MHFFERLRIDLQISIFGFSHELLVFSIFYRENVKSESSTPLTDRLRPFENCVIRKFYWPNSLHLSQLNQRIMRYKVLLGAGIPRYLYPSNSHDLSTLGAEKKT